MNVCCYCILLENNDHCTDSILFLINSLKQEGTLDTWSAKLNMYLIMSLSSYAKEWFSQCLKMSVLAPNIFEDI